MPTTGRSPALASFAAAFVERYADLIVALYDGADVAVCRPRSPTRTVTDARSKP